MHVSHQAEEISPPLSDLFQETFLTLSFSDLLVKCNETFQKLSITPQQAKNLEATTCTQSLSKTWFKYRTGHITASKFKATAHTDSSDPSPSSIKAICYPESLKINTAATKWGCMHEKDALKAYMTYRISGLNVSHLNPKVVESGLVISPDYPHLGATPDAFVKCDCCEQIGVLEVKCPYRCHSNTSILEANKESDFCLG